MAKTAKEVTSDIKIIIDGNNTNELSEFNGKKYYASIKDKEGKYLVTGSEPNIKSNKSWCQARIDRGAAVVSDDGKNDKGALIKIKCDKNIGTRLSYFKLLFPHKYKFNKNKNAYTYRPLQCSERKE